MATPFIDVHAHFLPPFYRHALAEAGHLPGPDGFHKIPVRRAMYRELPNMSY